MMRRIVVLPLPEAPSRTSTSPSATSKLMFSSTLAFPKRLLMPNTLAAAAGRVGSGSSRFGMSVSFAFTIQISINVQPVAREKQHTEDQERKQREDDRDRVRRFDLAFVELRENVERRSLCSSGEISGDENRRAKLADR